MNFFNKILVPVDFSSISDAGIRKAMELAIKCESSEVHFLYVVDNSSTGQFVSMDTFGFVASDFLANVIKEAEVKLAELLDECKDFEQLNFFGEVVQGELPDCVARYIDQNGIELVVMGTSGISGMRELLFGSNAHRITSKISCPVLTLQPFGQFSGIKKIIVPVEEFYPMNKLHFAAILARLFSAEIHLVCLQEKLHSETKKTFPVLFQVTEKLDLLSIPYKVYASSYSKNITDAILIYSEKEQIDLILVNPGEESKLTGKVLTASGGQIVNHAHVPVLTVHKDANTSDNNAIL